jgi:SAM-dependent methyltransferase
MTLMNRDEDEGRPASLSGCASGCACAVGNEFGERQARRDQAAYRKRGPARTTKWLIDGLADGGVAAMTVLDIGAGVGAVHLALLEAGATSAIDVDGSPAYVAVAREEAARAGRTADVRHEVGDFVELAPGIPVADLVALDRVVCCDPDMAALVRLSAGRARLRYGLVYPRDVAWIRFGARILNGFARLFRQRVRAWVHRTADVDALIRAAGFTPRLQRSTMFWQVVVYERT